MARKRTQRLNPPGMSAWADCWKRFLHQHRGWWRAVSSARRGAPVYALRPEIVTELAASPDRLGVRKGGNQALMDDDEKAAEEAFWEACQGYSKGTVGVWDDRPVEYELLAPEKTVTLSPSLIVELGWDQLAAPEQIRRSGQELADKAELVRGTQRGRAGWLTFNLQYRSERSDLQARYSRLPTALSWPLSGSLPPDEPSLPLSSVAAAGRSTPG